MEKKSFRFLLLYFISCICMGLIAVLFLSVGWAALYFYVWKVLRRISSAVGSLYYTRNSVTYKLAFMYISKSGISINCGRI